MCICLHYKKLLAGVLALQFGLLFVALPQGLRLKRRNLLENINIPLNPLLFGITQWQVGESSKYKVTLFHPDYLEVFQLTFSVVGAETRGSNAQLFWLETDVQPLNSSLERVVNKILRPFGDLTRFTEGAVGDVLSQVGENPPVAVPVSMLNLPDQKGRKWTHVDLGLGEIRVVAGNFKIHKQRFIDPEENSADVFSDSRVGPVGIIKVSSKRWNLELLGHEAKGGVSAIFGTPVQLVHP